MLRNLSSPPLKLIRARQKNPVAVGMMKPFRVFLENRFL